MRVTLTTSGGKHTVKYRNPTGPLFSVGEGVTFTLEEGVTLSGAGVNKGNRYSLVGISGGEFIIFRKPPAMPGRLEKAMPCPA